MNDIIKIAQALEDFNISLKAIIKTIENETKEQKEGFLLTLVGTLGASLLGHMLTGKEILRAGYGNNEGKRMVITGYRNREGKRILRVGYRKWNFNAASSFDKF